MLTRCLEDHVFDGLGKTPLESVRKAPIEEVLAVISDKNAM